MLSHFFHTKLDVHVIVIVHDIFGSLFVLVWFALGSFVSHSCNPHFGSRGCVRRIVSSDINDTNRNTTTYCNGSDTSAINDASTTEDINSIHIVSSNIISVINNRSNTEDMNISIVVNSIISAINNTNITEDMNISIVVNNKVGNDFIDISDVSKTNNIRIGFTSSSVISTRNIDDMCTNTESRYYCGLIIHIDNNNISCYYCCGLPSSLPSSRPNNGCIIVGHKDCYFISTNSIEYYYLWWILSIQSLRHQWIMVTVFIVSINDWKCLLHVIYSINDNVSHKKMILIIRRRIDLWYHCLCCQLSIKSIIMRLLYFSEFCRLSSFKSGYIYFVAILHNILDPCLISVVQPHY